MLWVKAFHVFFVISWFAGVFYLPRIYVNLAQEQNGVAYKRLLLMAGKLLRFITPIAILALFFGLWTWAYYGFASGPGWRWIHAKLLLVAALIGYHGYCFKLYGDFVRGNNRKSHVWFRWFNELPVFVLLAILILVIVKPF